MNALNPLDENELQTLLVTLFELRYGGPVLPDQTLSCLRFATGQLNAHLKKEMDKRGLKYANVY